jgi:ABC-2 type transport system permease protein
MAGEPLPTSTPPSGRTSREPSRARATAVASRYARYARLLRTQIRASLLLGLQYRADFVLDATVNVFWTGAAILPLVIVFQSRASIAGWSFGEALMVTGWFTFLEGVLDGAINPSVADVVDHVRKGTLDFVLLKPADAQFLVSTTRLQPWRATNVLSAVAIFAWGFHLLGRAPTPGAVGLATLSMLAAVAVLYSLKTLAVSAAFYFVRVDNLTHLFDSVFDAARWPSNIFRGVVSVVFTFVIPLALMTTYPAEALLGSLPIRSLFGALGGAVVALTLSRAVWNRAIAHYTSAGG